MLAGDIIFLENFRHLAPKKISKFSAKFRPKKCNFVWKNRKTFDTKKLEKKEKKTLAEMF
jgi:hypothetical protein